MTLSSLKQSLLKPLVSLWVFVWNKMPDRCKRLCFLTSLYARLIGCSEDDTAKLDEMNRSLGLTRDVNALRFPALVAPLIWRSVTVNPKIDIERSERYIGTLLKKAPCWLWYADEATIRNDLRQLFEICRNSSIADRRATAR